VLVGVDGYDSYAFEGQIEQEYSLADSTLTDKYRNNSFFCIEIILLYYKSSRCYLGLECMGLVKVCCESPMHEVFIKFRDSIVPLLTLMRRCLGITMLLLRVRPIARWGSDPFPASWVGRFLTAIPDLYSLEGCLNHPIRRFVILLFSVGLASHRIHSPQLGMSFSTLFILLIFASLLILPFVRGLLIIRLFTRVFLSVEGSIFSFCRAFMEGIIILLDGKLTFLNTISIPALTLFSYFLTLSLNSPNVQHVLSPNIYQSALVL
jgi:hypothetical protein